MPDRQNNKSEGDKMTTRDPPDDADEDDPGFVEVDPTRRYGRVPLPTSI